VDRRRVTEPFTAVILAGGQGRRLGGVDKAALEVGGRTLLGGVLEAAGGAAQTVVVGPPRDGLDGVVTVCEDPPGGGPLAALATGVGAVQTDALVLLAADLPFVTRADVDSLLAALVAAPTVAAAVAIDDGGQLQWLLAAWRVDALRHALERIGAPGGRPLRHLAAMVSVTATTLPGDPRRRGPAWFDVDTAEQLSLARRSRERPTTAS
jgi:molybdopterin-guanine dinucleotide biosynthesis protein A